MHKILENSNIKYNLSKYDIESIFNIHNDKNNNIVFNINETTYFNIPESMISSFILDHPLHWSTISYRIYGTTRLAWFLVKLNNVSLSKIFKRVDPASVVFYIDANKIEALLKIIRTQMMSE